MSLADIAQTVPAGSGVLRCGLGHIIGKLAPEDLTILNQWLAADSGKTNRWIADVLKADGHLTTRNQPPSAKVVEVHRRARCSCG